jgi:hypothetical protein
MSFVVEGPYRFIVDVAGLGNELLIAGIPFPLYVGWSGIKIADGYYPLELDGGVIASGAFDPDNSDRLNIPVSSYYGTGGDWRPGYWTLVGETDPIVMPRTNSVGWAPSRYDQNDLYYLHESEVYIDPADGQGIIPFWDYRRTLLESGGGSVQFVNTSSDVYPTPNDPLNTLDEFWVSYAYYTWVGTPTEPTGPIGGLLGSQSLTTVDLITFDGSVASYPLVTVFSNDVEQKFVPVHSSDDPVPHTHEARAYQGSKINYTEIDVSAFSPTADYAPSVISGGIGRVNNNGKKIYIDIEGIRLTGFAPAWLRDELGYGGGIGWSRDAQDDWQLGSYVGWRQASPDWGYPIHKRFFSDEQAVKAGDLLGANGHLRAFEGYDNESLFAAVAPAVKGWIDPGYALAYTFQAFGGGTTDRFTIKPPDVWTYKTEEVIFRAKEEATKAYVLAKVRIQETSNPTGPTQLIEVPLYHIDISDISGALAGSQIRNTEIWNTSTLDEYGHSIPIERTRYNDNVLYRGYTLNDFRIRKDDAVPEDQVVWRSKTYGSMDPYGLDGILGTSGANIPAGNQGQAFVSAATPVFKTGTLTLDWIQNSL